MIRKPKEKPNSKSSSVTQYQFENKVEQCLNILIFIISCSMPKIKLNVILNWTIVF